MPPDLRQVSAGTTWLLVAEEPKSTQVKLAPEGGRIGGAAGSHVVNAQADARAEITPGACLS